MYDVIIIGGGLSGLINGILLARNNRRVLLLEKKSFPFHRVCGEYVSNEVRPFLQGIDCFPNHLGPSRIDKFQLTSTQGNSVDINLDLGGFGISRFKFDEFLADKLINYEGELKTEVAVNNVSFDDGRFKVFTTTGQLFESKVVIGSFGKRSVLDKSLDRAFMKKRSPYVGVKYHVKTELPDDLIALHNFEGGYCGISKIEDDKYNLCYLASREVLKESGSIPSMEEKVLMKNPWLQRIFKNSEFLYDQPEVINEISFARKEPVYNHILMSGDAAGMIAPLCGNGMAMAIHGAKICSTLVNSFLDDKISRKQMERKYTYNWNRLFARRLWLGRKIQGLFGSGRGSDFAVNLLKSSPVIARIIIKQTHGKPF